MFSSTAVDPAQAVDPEVARNANIYNIWTLGLKTGELKQFTDSLGGNLAPVILRESKNVRVAFITYYKGEYGLHAIDLTKPLKAVATADFGSPGPIIDFQAPLTHTLVSDNVRKKKRFEKMYMEGRPSFTGGVTNSGDFYGGTEISLTDVLGDHRLDFTAGAVMQYTTFAGSYTNMSRRFQYAAPGDLPEVVLLRQQRLLLRPAAAALRRPGQRGVHAGDHRRQRLRHLPARRVPADRAERRALLSVERLQQRRDGLLCRSVPGCGTSNISGTLMPLAATFVQETTVFREFGPLSGNTIRAMYEYAPPIGSLMSRQTIDGDFRYYQRLFGTGLLAFRGRGFKSIGDYPAYTYFGGMSEMRGYDYYQFSGTNAVFGDVELRFPLIEAMLTPIGLLGGVRGVFFFNIGAGLVPRPGLQVLDVGYRDLPATDRRPIRMRTATSWGSTNRR